MKKSLLAILFGMAVLSFGAFNFTSCEVGLGAAVDVEAPTLVIESPKTSVIIRDAFAISGTWKDDGNIDELTVVLRDTTTDKKTSYTGTVVQNPESEEAEGSWSVIIDPVTEDIVDGSYEATVTISDKGGHSTVLTRSFVIDNTAPIIVLTRPSTAADSESSDTYGQTFTLEGQAADTNSVNLIEVEIYSDKACTPESYLHTVPLKNVPNSINMDVAKFEKGITDNDYYKIYKDATTDGGAKDFYCKVIAYDGAQRYPTDGSAPTEADKKGNATSNYYLYKDIATEILSEYKVNKVYEIFNGTFQDDGIARTITKESVIEKLSKNVRTEGRFTLNPKNNPTFAVTGRNPLLLDGTDFAGTSNNISDGSQVVIEVSPGLDGILLDKDSLKVYAVECDANGRSKGSTRIYPETGAPQESGTSYRFVTTISRSKGFEINKTYIFGVEGYDQSTAKNPVEPASTAYGFKMAPSGKAPTLTVTAPESISYVKKGGSITFAGTVAVEAGVPELTLFKGSEAIHTFEFNEAAGRNVGSEMVYDFSYTYNGFPTEGEEAKSQEFDFKLESSQSGNVSDYKPTLTVLYAVGDPNLVVTVKGPTVSSTIYPNSANTNGFYNINGNFEFSGTLAQKVGLYDVMDYDKSTWTFASKDKNGAAKTQSGKLAAAFEQTIDTTAYGDCVPATLTVYAEDRAGNKTTKTFDYFINQASDKPRFTAQNFDVSVNTEALLDERIAQKKANTLPAGAKPNMFTSSQSLKFSVADDDGVQETKVSVNDAEPIDADSLSLTDGKSKLVFYVYDINYDSTKDAAYNANYVYSFTVWVLQGQAPNVKLNPSPDYVTTLVNTSEDQYVISSDAKKTFTVIGTVSGVGEYSLSYQDDGGIHNIYYKKSSDPDTAYTKVTPINGEYKLYPDGDTVSDDYKKTIIWKDEFTPMAGSVGGTVSYTVNGALNSKDEDFVYSVDSNRPTITLTDTSVGNTGSGIYGNSFRFNGAAADTGVGLSKVEINFTNKGEAINQAKWKTVTGLSDWGETIYFTNNEFPCFTTQSQKTMHVRATDGAGNYSEVATKDFNYDTAAPTLTIDNEPSGYLPKTQYSLTGHINEVYGMADTAKLTVKEYLKVNNDYELHKTAEFDLTRGTGNNSNEYNWTVGIPLDNTELDTLSGNLKYEFEASDVNGNLLVSTPLNLTRDVEPPTVSITSPSSNTFGINSISGTSATITGSVTEKDKDKLYYQIKAGTAAADDNWEEHDITDLSTETATWRKVISLDTTAYPDGKYTLYVKASDKAGNESAPVSQYFAIDRASPAVTVKVISDSGEEKQTLSGSQTIKVTSGTGYIIQIEATDDSGIEESAVVLTDVTTSETGTPVTLSKSGDVWTSPSVTTEGTKSYKIEVTDNSGNGTTIHGKTTEKSKAAIFDINDPAASIETIASDLAWISGTGKVYISGEASDASGIKSITMKLIAKKLNGETVESEKTVPVANPWTYELNCSELAENDNTEGSYHTLVLTVTDNCEKSTPITRKFKLDKTTPVIKNLSVKNATTGAFTKSITDVKASGLAYDGDQANYRPVTVTIEAKKSNAAVDIGGTDKVITVTTTETHNNTFGKFDQAVATKTLADGEYTFTVKATDYAGNTAEEGTVITVDTEAPVLTTPTLDGWNDKHSSAKVNVTFTEKNPDAVYYYVNDYSDKTITAADKVKENDWTVMTLAVTTTTDEYTASKSHSFADGHGVVYVKVVDKAGNVSYGTTAEYEVDTKKPDICTLQTVDGAALNGSKLINGQNDVVFTVTASDYNDNNIQSTGLPVGNDVTRVASVKLTQIGSGELADKYTGDNIVSGVATQTTATTDTPAKKTGEWTITIPKDKFSGKTTGSYPVTVTVEDIKGNSKEFQLFTLDVDTGKPEIKSYSLDSSYDAGLVGETGSEVQTFYVNNTRDAFKLTGIAKDDREIDKVTLTLTGKIGNTATTKTLESSDSAWTFEIANGTAADAWKKWTGPVTATLSVVDKAKNPTATPTAQNKLPPLSFKIIFDTTAPVGKHQLDAKNKDLYFRLGNENNDDIAEADLQEKDKNAGKKYSATTYGKSETIKFHGSFTETGSGLKRIYYKIFASEPNENDISTFKSNYETDTVNTGSFSPQTETKRVFYNPLSSGSGESVTYDGTLDGYFDSEDVNYVSSVVDSSVKYYSDITSDFVKSISGFNEGKNYLVLLAVDNVDNPAIDVMPVSRASTATRSYYTINRDTVPPEIEPLASNAYTNAEEDLELEFTITDAIDATGVEPAGIDKVTVNIKDVADRSKNKRAEPENGVYKVTIPKDDLPGAADTTGSYAISVTAKDKAGEGNSNTITVGSVIVDRKKPIVKIGNISDADISTTDKLDVNGTLTISGTAEDESGFDSEKPIKVEYSENGTDWNEITGLTGTNNNWSVAVDTTNTTDTSKPIFTDNTSYTVRVTAKDLAGNEESETKEIYINQNSDRPVIKFTNLDRLGEGTAADPYSYILKYGTRARLEGSITDDDADSSKVVTTFKASTSPITSETANSIGSLITYNAASGDFTFEPYKVVNSNPVPDTADGQKTIYFYIKDNKGKEYYSTYNTGSNPALNRPYQIYKTDAKTNNIETLTYRSDGTPPESTVQLQAYTATAVTENGETTYTYTENGSKVSLGANCLVGGPTKNSVDFTVTATDGNGIRGVVVILEQGTTKKYYRSNSLVSEENITAYEETASVAAITSTDDYTYTTKKIDISSFAEGNVTVYVKAYDQSGLYSNQQSVVKVDKTGPTFTLSGSTKDGDIVYGIQSNTVGGSVSDIDVEKIYYAVSLSETAPDAMAGDSTDDFNTDGEIKNNLKGKWNLVRNAGTSATLVMYDGTTTVENAFISQSLRSWLMALQNKTSDELNEDDTRVDMYIHFKAVDTCGNEGTPVCRRLSVYPNGDKPVIELVYPENKADGSEPSLSGTIRVYGYASAAIGRVEATYLQIDPDYDIENDTQKDGSKFNESGWRSALSTLIAPTKARYPTEKIGNHELYGIKAEGTGNWNLSINGFNEFNKTTGNRVIAIRIYALSESGKISEPYTQLLTIDPNAPHIGAENGTSENATTFANRKYRLQIVDFKQGTTYGSTETAFSNFSETKAYKSEMWVKGQKYLIASVYDDTGIKSITLNEKIQGVEKKVLVEPESGVPTIKSAEIYLPSGSTQNKAISITESICGEAGKKNYNICIPLPTGVGSGSLEWELEAVENSDSNNRCKETIIINYDNTAPKLGTADHEKYNINADIKQSNGFYTMKGWATDADGDNKVSGIMGVAFYFMRRGSSSTRVYDPMYKDNYATGKHNYVDVTGANPSGITYSNGLFWKHQTGITVSSSSKLESVLTVTADDNIHKGGLALIGGTIYRISDVSGTSVTVEGEVSLSETTADFALALVVDNLSKKEKTDGRNKITTATSYGYGYYAPHDTADDGDLMVEDWDGTSAEGQWTAIINSANIPDGPIELHYVAFDKSQNYAVGIVGNVNETNYLEFDTKDVTANKDITGTNDSATKLASNFYYAYSTPAYVSNNAPRIAGVIVGTDYNGDGNITDGSDDDDGNPTLNEKKASYASVGNRLFNGTAQSKITGVVQRFIASSNRESTGSPMMTVKDKISIELEIIGGNGDMYYQYSIDDEYKAHDDITSFTEGNYGTGKTSWQITRTDGEGYKENDDGKQGYYTTTVLPPINFSEDDLITAVGGEDGENGTRWWTVEIWDSTEETTKFSTSQHAELKLPLDVQVLDKTTPNTFINDLYWNSSTDNSVYINTSGDEDVLEGHIELKDYLGTGFTSANYGTDDDKISGKVVFRGYAYDNKRLKSLNWGIKDALTGTIKQAWPQAYITPVSYNPATGKWGVDPADDDNATEWTETGSSGNASVGLPYYYFKVYDDEAHGAYLNENGHKVYWELIVDTSYVQKPGESSQTDAWAVGKDLYVYVQATDNSDRTTDMNPTVVTTGTDAQKLRPNYKVDVVPYITGIKSRLSDNRSSNGRYQIADNETGVELIGYNLKQGSANLTIDLPTASGAYSKTIQNCVTINNLNNNEATASTPTADAGKYKNKYNYQTSSYNKSLTDDVYIDLWQFNNRAAQTNTGYGFIQEPVMKFNPRNGNLGFSFSNGANKFSMAQGQTNSYILWEYNYASYVRNALAFDERGRSHGISVGIDTEPSTGKSGRMNYFYSNWGRSDVDNNGNFRNNKDGNFRQDTNANHIDCIGVPNGNNLSSNTPPGGGWDGGGAGNCIIMEQRFKSVSMVATTKKGTDTYDANPRVYIAYYDDIREQITFKYGEITGAARDTYGQIQSSGNPNGGDGRAFSVSGDYWSVIADGGNATPYKPGEYLDIAVKPGTSVATDTVCAVWFDATNNNLMYSYKVNPGTDNDASTRTGTYTDGYWSNAVTLKQNCGEYCKIAIDANGGIHIVAYDKGNKGVGYVYLPSYNSTYNEANNYYIIDAVNGPYDELGIDVAVDGTGANGKAYPTISYYANGTPKMATYSTGITQSTGKPEKSWDNSSFTGKWDVCFVPTSSNLLKDHINVAQPKGQNGVRARVSTTNNFAKTGGQNDGTVTGNTTTNPILGYAIREGAKGYLEIAQRK